MRFSPAFFRRGNERNNRTRARHRMRGTAAPALLLFIALIVLVGVTVFLFASGFFAAPPPVTAVGVGIDHQYNLTLYVTGIAFVLAQLGLGWAVFRYRDRGKPAHFTRGNSA